ncbi:superfamily II DNA or RNA helicase [Mycolicibacterium iranicum]|uniref:Superfamily II DNA or RNA helicase n=1 Tax=Mycolicibacterium iranicum TaxID=912594 RepID=A0A839Q2K8_MYCIR|nr:helicase-related protein [Mycolicibacterium iranicum]MBB2989653.1 superfamily II DNA or RNA helicase [Mycolicibacterium iranicum]
MQNELAHLTPGVKVEGLVPGAVVEIIDITRAGVGAFVRFRDEFGIEDSRLFSADQLTDVRPLGGGGPTLAADPNQFWLAIEALRLRHASALTPLLAVSSSNVEALPHQVQAVYDYMLSGHPKRFLLADDPGAGKTIMAGLFIKEALARGWVRRCLIVVPGSLVEQWQNELRDKFALHFEIFERSLLSDPEDESLQPFPFLIARLDQFSRSKHLESLTVDGRYDVAIFDEAHKLAVSAWGGTVTKTKRFQLAEAIRDSVPSTLLMTATPHNGKDADYRAFLDLLRSADEPTVNDPAGDRLMRRLVKEQLVHLDGSPLFPERRANTVPYKLSSMETELYEAVSEYVREEMNKVSDDDTRRSVGFALVVLQRRLASSPQAILRSLTRRRDRLRAQADQTRNADEKLAARLAATLGLATDDPDEMSSLQAETYQDEVVSAATNARTPAELEAEILVLDQLVTKAEAVYSARVDAKWGALAELLTSSAMYEPDGRRRKIIIFTENRDTLDYLEDRLAELLARSVDVQVIHGAMPWADRRRAQASFIGEPASSVLIATDAAGEGVNLQVAHLMVNYDVPWNPNRLEQRFGRIHRIGQRHTCHLWNLVAADTREGDVFRTLLEKLEVQREALGDQVFDVLGDVLTEMSLSQLLTRAVAREAATDEINAELDSVSGRLERAVAKRTESVSTLTPEELSALRHEMELARAMSFQPHVVRDFVLRAAPIFHVDIAQRGNAWQIAYVPTKLRDLFGSSLMPHYDRVAFEHADSQIFATDPPELIAPGHPLLSALIEAVGGEFESSLSDGIVLSDSRSSDDYVLVTVVSTSGSAASIVATYAVTPRGDRQEVSSSLYTDLTMAPVPELHEVAAAESAASAVSEGRPDRDITAIAYVRGSASPSVAAAWRTAREQLHRELTAEGLDPVAALPGQGWDFTTGSDEITFWSAAPPGEMERRRAEKHVASNVESRYRVYRNADSVRQPP